MFRYLGREAAGRSPLVAPKIINLSAKGVCIVSEAQLHPGEPLEVELTVPETRSNVKARGTVRWAEPQEENGRRLCRAGLEFDQPIEALVPKGEGSILDILHNLRVAVAQLRLYPKESPQVLKVATDTFNSVFAYLEEAESLTLSRTPRGLLVNGRELATGGAVADSLASAMIALLSDSQIKSISCKKGLTPDELLTFLHALTKKFWDVKDGKEINRRLREERVFRISVDEVQYVALGEGDIVIEDAARKLESGKTEVAKVVAALDQIIESASQDGLGAEARLQIMKRLLEHDPSLLDKAGEASPPPEQATGKLGFEGAKEALGELSRLIQDVPPLFRERLRKVGRILASAFREDGRLSAALESVLSEEAAEALPQVAEEVAAKAPEQPAAILKLKATLQLPDDEKIAALAQEGAGLVDELWAMGQTEPVREILETLTGFLGDRSARKRIAASRALAGMQGALARNAPPEMVEDLDRSVRSGMEHERDANAYHALVDMASFIADLWIRNGRFEASRAVLEVLLRHYRIKDEAFVQRGELAYIALERVAAGPGFASLADRIRAGDADSVRIVEALGAAAARFLIREIKAADTAAKRLQFAYFLAKAGPSAATVLLDEIQKTTVPSDLLRLVEILPQSMASDMAEMALPGLLRHGVVVVRRRAAALATEQAYPAVGRLILDALGTEQDPATRATYVECLGRLKHKPALEVLCGIVDSRSEADEGRVAACLALGRLGDVRAVAILRKLLYRGEKGLTKMLRAVSPVVRAAAARGLAAFPGSPEAREALRWAQEDRDPTVRSAAVQARYALLHEAFGEGAVGAQIVSELGHVTKETGKIGGVLQEIPFADLCRAVAGQEKTGLLSVNLNGPVAKVYFDTGLVIAAELESRRDQDVFNAVAGRREGYFLFQPEITAPDRRILVPVENLLREALGRGA